MAFSMFSIFSGWPSLDERKALKCAFPAKTLWLDLSDHFTGYWASGWVLGTTTLTTLPLKLPTPLQKYQKTLDSDLRRLPLAICISVVYEQLCSITY